MTFHSKLIGPDEIHVPHEFEYVDAATRVAATGFIDTDLKKLALQTDNDSLWVLSAHTPATVWTPVAGTGNPGGGDTEIQFNDGGVFGGSLLFWDKVNNRLGFNVSSPGKDFEISKDGATFTQEISVYSNTLGHSVKYQTIRGRGTKASSSAVQDGDALLLYNIRASDAGGGSDELAARLKVNVEGTVSTGKVPCVWKFETEDLAGALGDGFAIGPDYVRVYKALRVPYIATAVNYQTLGESIIGVTDTTVARTITLSSVDIARQGWKLQLQDESGGAGSNNITIATEGSEVITGPAVINTNDGSLDIYSNGTKVFTK